MNYKIHVPEEASQKRQWRQDRKKINKEKTTKTIPKRDKTNKIELATQLLHANKAINVHLQSQIQNNSKTTTHKGKHPIIKSIQFLIMGNAKSKSK